MAENAAHSPVVAEIPEGAVVTIHLRNGKTHTGTDDTTRAQEDAGVFAMFKTVGSGHNQMNHKMYVLASEIIGFEIEYD